MNEDKDVVLVTGFQPFGVHKINASWEAVKLLPKYKIDNVQIVVEEVPVLYKYVEENIPLLWKKYNPKVNKCYKYLYLFKIFIISLTFSW